MSRRARYIAKWWLLGILVFTSLTPQPVGARSAAPAPREQSTTNLPIVETQATVADVPWPMAGANPQRTSWTAEQVPSADYLAAHRNEHGNGMLSPQWYRPIEPYIPHKVQIVAADGSLFISTAQGLYALDADTGDVKWVYPTELPLGHSPTYHETTLFGAVHPKRLYVGGLDHKLYAIDADPNLSTLPIDPATGQRINNQLIWAYEAQQGFQTNPLAVELNNPADGRTHLYVYAGNRDSFHYAIEDRGSSAALFWKYKTDGPVLFSTAIANDNQTVFFASDDSHAYALKAVTTIPEGQLVWKSQKLPGSGFHSWWPVVYSDPQTQQAYILLGGSHNYRDNVPPGPNGSLVNLEHLDREAFPQLNNNGGTQTRGTPVGPRGSDGWIDTSKPNGGNSAIGISTYFENKPWRRTVFLLDGNTGQEATFDSDGDGKREYAPFIWLGSQSGNRYPAVIGKNRLVYQASGYLYADWINGGGITGWQMGTPLINQAESYWHAVDEPVYYAAGGNLIYWSMHTDLAAGAFDSSVANTQFDEINAAREWVYWNQGPNANDNLLKLFANYDEAAGGWDFGGRNGTYGRNGDGNPPIPYRGKVYMHKGNAILAFGTTQKAQGTKLSMAKAVTVKGPGPAITTDQLKQKLADEIQKMIAKGHLRPGYLSSGHVDLAAKYSCGDSFQDYYSNPADLIYTLTRALPYLPADMVQPAKSYLQSEFASYAPDSMTHIGWRAGANRDFFDLPPDVDTDRANYGPTEWWSYEFVGWGQKYGGTNYPPHMFYALWKYAQAQGYTQVQAKALFDRSQGRLDTTPPSSSLFAQYPFVLNSFISGYLGYLELQKMAGYIPSTNISSQLASLRSLRASTFTKDTYYAYGTPNVDTYCRAFSASANFIYLTPELGDYLRANALSKVQAALSEYDHNTPYWFVARYEDTIFEGIFAPLYDLNLFQAKALILKEPREELVKYLDVPAFPVGDLFYIQNLVAAIEADSTPPTSSPISLRAGWNLVALPLSPADPSPAAVFASIASELVGVYKYDACDTADPWKRYDPAAPAQANDLVSVDARVGLWVQTRSDATLVITGAAPTNVTIPLCQGDNLIAYPSRAPVALPDALASIAGKYSTVHSYEPTDVADPWKMFSPSVPSAANDLTAVGPGKGYWVDMSSPAVLQLNP